MCVCIGHVSRQQKCPLCLLVVSCRASPCRVRMPCVPWRSVQCVRIVASTHTPMSSRHARASLDGPGWRACSLCSLLDVSTVHESSRMHQLSRCDLPCGHKPATTKKSRNKTQTIFTVTAIVDCQSTITNYAYELNRTHNNTTNDGRIDECKSNHLIRAIIYRSLRQKRTQSFLCH